MTRPSKYGTRLENVTAGFRVSKELKDSLEAEQQRQSALRKRYIPLSDIYRSALVYAMWNGLDIEEVEYSYGDLSELVTAVRLTDEQLDWLHKRSAEIMRPRSVVERMVLVQYLQRKGHDKEEA